jgi:hypothetical protein
MRYLHFRNFSYCDDRVSLIEISKNREGDGSGSRDSLSDSWSIVVLALTRGTQT